TERLLQRRFPLQNRLRVRRARSRNFWRDSRIEKGFAPLGGLDGVEQVVCYRTFDYKPARSGIERLAHHFLGIMLGQNQYLRAWKSAADRSRRFQTIQVWHADVHDD